jgi:hypothetical protein
VPRRDIVRMGNCSATLVRLRERRGHVHGDSSGTCPSSSWAGTSGEGVARLFR